jgi:hypothetical protein
MRPGASWQGAALALPAVVHWRSVPAASWLVPGAAALAAAVVARWQSDPAAEPAAVPVVYWMLPARTVALTRTGRRAHLTVPLRKAVATARRPVMREIRIRLRRMTAMAA